MKRIEITGLIVIGLLLFFRVFVGMQLHVLLRILLVLTSIFYLWFGFFLFNKLGVIDLFHRSARKNLSPFKITSSIVAGFVYSVSFISIIHNLEFYRGMHFLTLLALLLNSLLLAWGGYLTWKESREGVFLKPLFYRSLIFTVLFLGVWVTPLETRLNLLYKEHPSFIEAYKAHMEEPDDQEKLQQLREERSAFR